MSECDIKSLSDKFDILLFVHGIAIGLAITKILELTVNLIMREKSISYFRGLWLFILLIYIIQYWFFTVRWKNTTPFSDFFQYGVSLLIPLMHYLMATIICTTRTSAATSSKEDPFDKSGKFFFLIVGMTLILAILENMFIQKSLHLSYPSENIIRFIVGLTFLVYGIFYKPSLMMKTFSFILLGYAALFRLLMEKYPI